MSLVKFFPVIKQFKDYIDARFLSKNTVLAHNICVTALQVLSFVNPKLLHHLFDEVYNTYSKALNSTILCNSDNNYFSFCLNNEHKKYYDNYVTKYMETSTIIFALKAVNFVQNPSNILDIKTFVSFRDAFSQTFVNLLSRQFVMDSLIIKDCNNTENYGYFQKYVTCIDQKNPYALSISAAASGFCGFMTTGLILDEVKDGDKVVVTMSRMLTKNTINSGAYGFYNAPLNYQENGQEYKDSYTCNVISTSTIELADSLIKEYSYNGIFDGFAISTLLYLSNGDSQINDQSKESKYLHVNATEALSSQNAEVCLVGDEAEKTQHQWCNVTEAPSSQNAEVLTLGDHLGEPNADL